MPDRRYRAGESLQDFCRACKLDRLHTVVAADPEGTPLRVVCGYCGSEHNYRGGPRLDPPSPGERVAEGPGAARARAQREPFPIVSERERSAPPMTPDGEGSVDLEMLLRRIIREEAGVTPAAPAEKWRGGTLVLRPGCRRRAGPSRRSSTRSSCSGTACACSNNR